MVPGSSSGEQASSGGPTSSSSSSGVVPDAGTSSSSGSSGECSCEALELPVCTACPPIPFFLSAGWTSIAVVHGTLFGTRSGQLFKSTRSGDGTLVGEQQVDGTFDEVASPLVARGAVLENEVFYAHTVGACLNGSCATHQPFEARQIVPSTRGFIGVQPGSGLHRLLLDSSYALALGTPNNVPYGVGPTRIYARNGSSLDCANYDADPVTSCPSLPLTADAEPNALAVDDSHVYVAPCPGAKICRYDPLMNVASPVVNDGIVGAVKSMWIDGSVLYIVSGGDSYWCHSDSCQVNRFADAIVSVAQDAVWNYLLDSNGKVLRARRH